MIIADRWTQRTRVFLAVALSTILSLSFVLMSAPPARAADACALSPANWKSSLLSLAGPSTTGWIAGDGFASAKLNDNQTLFINQDTFVGTITDHMTSGNMPHNTALIYDKTNPGCWTFLNGNTLGGLFPTGGNPDTDYYWPNQPAVNGNVVAMTMSRMGPVPGNTGGAFNFQLNAMELKTFTWTGSQFVQRSYRKFGNVTANPPGGLIGWTNNLSKDGWTYMVGGHLRTGMWGHDIYLSRVPTTEFFAATGRDLAPNMEYLTPAGWKKNATYSELKKIYDASSDAIASLVWSGKEYHFVTKEYSFLGANVVDVHGPTLEGPLDKHTLGPVPYKADSWTYGAQVHPEFGHTGWNYNVSIKYNNAVTDEGWAALWHMDRYRPELAPYILPETARISTGRPNSLVFGNLTVTEARGGGHLIAYPCNTPKPLASNLNYTGSQNLANFTAVKTDPNGELCVYTTTPTHILFDQVSGSVDATAYPPVRKIDTRNTGTPAAAGSTTVINTGAPNSLVFGNLTVTQTQNPGHAIAYPCDQPRPLASNINYVAGQTLANFAAVKTDPNGNFCVYTTTGTHLLFDQTADTQKVSAYTPVRKIDTRDTGTPAAAGSTTVINTGAANSLVFGNLTVTQTQNPGHATAYPCNQARPLASNINYVAGQTIANFAAVRADPSGNICVYTTAETHLLFDQTADITPPPNAVYPQSEMQPTQRRIDTRINNG